MQTTLMLPDDLLAAVDDAVREGQASSRDELIVEAIRRWFASVDGEAIDLAFASMADDEE
jgi:metal-responsive CopG/Arc/MetJ family transcriptional regulator